MPETPGTKGNGATNTDLTSTIDEIRSKLKTLYLNDARPWLVGFSGGKDSTLVATLVYEVLLELPKDQRIKPITLICTDTRVEIPAVVEKVEATLSKMSEMSAEHGLNVEVQLLKPPPEQSFWVNIIGRGYPAPNRSFRWCTQRMKIDPVTRLVEQKLGRWGEAILHLGARRSESATRAQTMAGRQTKSGLRRHEDLPNVWISNPIEFLSTDDVWEYLLENPNPWRGDNQALFALYKGAAGGECPLVVDETTPSCGNSRFGCWTCTVVDRDKSSEGLLASGDSRMQHLLEYRELLLKFRDPSQGYRDERRMNGTTGAGPLTLAARKELLTRLLSAQEQTGLDLISEEELLLIQRFWKSARQPDDGQGVARIVHQSQGTAMTSELREVAEILELEDRISREKGVSADTLRRMLSKVEEYTESHRAMGLPDDLMNILKDDLNARRQTLES